MPHRRDPESARSEIREAALAEFLQHGYDASTLEGVAARVGLTRQAVLYHFRSKEALLRSLVDPAFEAIAATLDVLEQERRPGGPTHDDQVAVLSRLVAVTYEHRGPVGLVGRFAHDHAGLGLGPLMRDNNVRLATLLAGDRFATDDATRIRTVACMAALAGVQTARVDVPLDTPAQKAVLVSALAGILRE